MLGMVPDQCYMDIGIAGAFGGGSQVDRNSGGGGLHVRG
jgi:hypothetical protein